MEFEEREEITAQRLAQRGARSLNRSDRLTTLNSGRQFRRSETKFLHANIGSGTLFNRAHRRLLGTGYETRELFAQRLIAFADKTAQKRNRSAQSTADERATFHIG